MLQYGYQELEEELPLELLALVLSTVEAVPLAVREASESIDDGMNCTNQTHRKKDNNSSNSNHSSSNRCNIDSVSENDGNNSCDEHSDKLKRNRETPTKAPEANTLEALTCVNVCMLKQSSHINIVVHNM